MNAPMAESTDAFEINGFNSRKTENRAVRTQIVIVDGTCESGEAT